MASDGHLARLKEGAAVWNEWRREQPLVRPDLQGLSLTPAQKQWGETSGGPINFAQSILREADLRYATLIDADLAGATLIAADLSGARLRNANLRGANLSHARFDGADLMGAQFAGANLSGADLSGARNLNASQIEAAHGDAKTLLPPQIGGPAGWRNGSAIAAPAPTAAASMTTGAAAGSGFSSILRHHEPSPLEPQSDPFADRFGRALRGLPRPRFDAVAGRARKAIDDLPRPSLDGIADRAKDALQGLPRPRLDGVAGRAKAAFKSLVPRPRFGALSERAKAIKNLPRAILGGVSERTRRVTQALPRPARIIERARLAANDLSNPKVIAIAGGAVLFLVFAFGGMLALRTLDNGAGTTSRSAPAPAVVAETQKARDIDVSEPQARTLAEVPQAFSEPASANAEPPQGAAGPEIEEPAAVEDMDRADAGASTVPVPVPRAKAVVTDVAPVAAPLPKAAVPIDGAAGIEVPRPGTQSLAVQDIPIKDADRAEDPLVRLAFAGGAKDTTEAPGTDNSAPTGNPAQTSIHSHVGQPAQVGKVEDSAKPTDLPKPTKLAKAPEPDLKPETSKVAPALTGAPQAQKKPTSVVEYLSAPQRSSDWIRVFIKDFYLSGDALADADVRRIYSHEVDYFGKRTSIDKVARETTRYYRDWPERHYALVPGSIDIKWKSAEVADVSFTYDYTVSAPDKKASKGRGRAHLTLDLRGPTGVIIREDGEVLAHK